MKNMNWQDKEPRKSILSFQTTHNLKIIILRAYVGVLRTSYSLSKTLEFVNIQVMWNVHIHNYSDWLYNCEHSGHSKHFKWHIAYMIFVWSLHTYMTLLLYLTWQRDDTLSLHSVSCLIHKYMSVMAWRNSSCHQPETTERILSLGIMYTTWSKETAPLPVCVVTSALLHSAGHAWSDGWLWTHHWTSCHLWRWPAACK